MKALLYLLVALLAGALYGLASGALPLILANIVLAMLLAIAVAVCVGKGAAKGPAQAAAPLYALGASTLALYGAWTSWWWVQTDPAEFLLLQPDQLWRSIVAFSEEATVAVSRGGTTAEMGTGWFYFSWISEAVGVTLPALAIGLLLKAPRKTKNEPAARDEATAAA